VSPSAVAASLAFTFARLQVFLAAPRKGFQDTLESPQEIFHGKCIVGSGTFCLNRTSILILLVAAVLSALLIAASARPRLIPGGLQSAAEAIYGFVRRDIVIGVMGPEGERYAPYLTSLFLFAFLASLCEVIPGIQFPITSRMAIPALLAILSWGIYNYAGIKAKGFGKYLKGIAFPPGVRPKAIYVLVTPIEVIAALFLRPLTLAIRLFANFFAGHLLLVVAFVGTAYLVGSAATAPFAVLTLVGGVIGIGLEIFIAAVQAYVFALLTAAYIRLSTVEEH
jgi:F-type H+-transporting ATPase subunit a